MPYDSLTRWQPDRTPELPQWPQPPTSIAMLRGACNRCPACGETKLFQGYLTVTPQCAHCGAPLGLARADDAPPYFTILVVAHLIVPPMYFVERAWEPPLWLHAAIWLPLALGLSLGLLRPIKGATVGLMLKLGLLKTDIDDR